MTDDADLDRARGDAAQRVRGELRPGDLVIVWTNEERDAIRFPSRGAALRMLLTIGAPAEGADAVEIAAKESSCAK